MDSGSTAAGLPVH